MTTIKDAFDDLFNNQQLTADEAAGRRYDREVASAQTQAGTTALVLANIVQFRKVMKHATITVLEELTKGQPLRRGKNKRGKDQREV